MSGALAARSECVLAIPVSGCACYFARFGAEIRRCFWQTLFFGVFTLFGAFEGLPGRSPGLLSEISGIDLISTGAGVVKLRARTKGRFFKKLLDFEEYCTFRLSWLGGDCHALWYKYAREVLLKGGLADRENRSNSVLRRHDLDSSSICCV